MKENKYPRGKNKLPSVNKDIDIDLSRPGTLFGSEKLKQIV